MKMRSFWAFLWAFLLGVIAILDFFEISGFETVTFISETFQEFANHIFSGESIEIEKLHSFLTFIYVLLLTAFASGFTIYNQLRKVSRSIVERLKTR